MTTTSESHSALSSKYDIIVAGGGAGGVSAALQAARSGASVLLLEETEWIGGQTTAAGVTSQDCATPLPLQSGIYKEFIDRIRAHYQKLGKSCLRAYFLRWPSFEPRVGRRILEQMLEESPAGDSLVLLKRAKVAHVFMEGTRITGVSVCFREGESRKEKKIACSVLIDATEWGDIIPMTGAAYRVGNCLNDAPVADRELQTMNSTVVVREYSEDLPASLRMKSPPPGYDVNDYDFLASDAIQVPPYAPQNQPWNFATLVAYRAMPDSRVKGNDPENAWAQADPAKPAEWKLRLAACRPTRTHLNRGHGVPVVVDDVENLNARSAKEKSAQLEALRLLYHIQTHWGKYNWSVADDEGYDTVSHREWVDHWIAEAPELEPFREILYHFPPIPYVRESRRIVGEHSLKASEIERQPRAPVQFKDVVAIGDYMVDIHQKVTEAVIEKELDTIADVPEHNGARGYGPYAIPFGCFIPETVDGLLAAEKNISQSRLVNGSTRVQPAVMQTGQAAGMIAALSVRYAVAPRKLDSILVQDALIRAKVPLYVTPLRDVIPHSQEWQAIQLCAARGLIEPALGWFRPEDCLVSLDLGKIRNGLPWLQQASTSDSVGAVSRQHLAELVGKLVQFEMEPEEAKAPVTRSEAAQILADALVSHAEGMMTGTTRPITWSQARAVAPTPAEDLSLALFPPSERWWMEDHCLFRGWFTGS